MIERLLDKLEPQRRHLAFLVGLLLLTFVLTIILAVQAQRAEAARQEQARAVLADLSGRAVTEWGRLLEERLSAAAVASVGRAATALNADPDVSLASLRERFRLEHLCQDCGSADARVTFFSLDIQTGEMETLGGDVVLPPDFALSVSDPTRLQDAVPLTDRVAFKAVFPSWQGGGAFAPVLVVRDRNGELVRVVGFAKPARIFTDAFGPLFGSVHVLPRAMSKGLPNDSFFSIRAIIGGLSVYNTGGLHDFAAADTMRAPFGGVVLHVGMRENAETRLLPDGALSSGMPLLLTLLVMICGLLMVSLLLVRREVQLVRLRADFVSSVSHELRTPLAQIRMFTETLLLNRVRSDLERRRSLQIIDQEARRLAHLVENVLLFSKSEGGRRTPIAPEPTELAAEVRRAAESFGPLCRARSVNLRTELQDNIVVAVDPCALRQIMLNLVDNALKYGPQGQRVTIGVALYDDVARLWVDDEGPGIPDAEQERVFESFFRLPRDVDSKSSGSGIGLAVVRELARLHAGDARAERAPGGGTRIVVEFPDAYLRTEPAADLASA
jgi:signal transduction histidine kinase